MFSEGKLSSLAKTTLCTELELYPALWGFLPIKDFEQLLSLSSNASDSLSLDFLTFLLFFFGANSLYVGQLSLARRADTDVELEDDLSDNNLFKVEATTFCLEASVLLFDCSTF